MREDIYLNVYFREKKEENVESVPGNKSRLIVERDEKPDRELFDLEKKKLKRSLYGKKYYQKNRERVLLHQKAYRQNMAPGKRIECLEKRREYFKNLSPEQRD